MLFQGWNSYDVGGHAVVEFMQQLDSISGLRCALNTRPPPVLPGERGKRDAIHMFQEVLEDAGEARESCDNVGRMGKGYYGSLVARTAR